LTFVENQASQIGRVTSNPEVEIRHHRCQEPTPSFDVLKERYQKELRWQLGNPEREDLTLRLWIEAIEEERSR
jgi:hypothetical protein